MQEENIFGLVVVHSSVCASLVESPQGVGIKELLQYARMSADAILKEPSESLGSFSLDDAVRLTVSKCVREGDAVEIIDATGNVSYGPTKQLFEIYARAVKGVET